jgi:SAC3/GANP family
MLGPLVGRRWRLSDVGCVPQDEFACGMFEEIIRYHILCEHELCGAEATVSNHEGFSSHLNVEQMNKVSDI